LEQSTIRKQIKEQSNQYADSNNATYLPEAAHQVLDHGPNQETKPVSQTAVQTTESICFTIETLDPGVNLEEVSDL